MSSDPFNLNGQAVAAELVRVMAERDEAREFKETYHEQWMLTARALEAAERRLADLRADIEWMAADWHGVTVLPQTSHFYGDELRALLDAEATP